MNIKKHIVVGDWVIARDGDKHFVSAQRLARLHGFVPSECIFTDITRPESFRGLPDLPRYYPRADGDYSKEKELP